MILNEVRLNFTVGGVPCVMFPNSNIVEYGTMFEIKPLRLIHHEGDPKDRTRHFGTQIQIVLDRLTGEDEDGHKSKIRKRNYEFESRIPTSNLATLTVFRNRQDPMTIGEALGKALQNGWDFRNFDFKNADLLIKFLRDWQRAIPGIVFTRDDGTEIEIP